MRLIFKLSMLVLLATVLVALNVPTYAQTATTSSCTSTCPASATTWTNTVPTTCSLAKLIAPSSKNYTDKTKLMYEICKTKANVQNYFAKTFGIQTMQSPVGTSAFKTMTRNLNGTWHVTIHVTVPTGLRAVVTDYLFNLNPIPTSFNVRPAFRSGNYIEWHLQSGSYALTFDARQIYPGSVGDQGFVYYYPRFGSNVVGVIPTNNVVD